MRISDLITPASIAVRVHIDDKADALRFAAMALGSRCGLDPERIRQALAQREALGSTGIGKGVAVPHVCLGDLDRPYGLFFTLARPIAFEAIDGAPVDLVCAIISPANADRGTSESLSLLAAISRILRNDERAAAMRKATDPWSVSGIIAKAAAAAAPA